MRDLVTFGCDGGEDTLLEGQHDRDTTEYSNGAVLVEKTGALVRHSWSWRHY